MEQLIVKKIENLTTSKGAPYKKIDVQKTDGSIVAGVSAFSFKYPDLVGLVEGATITASIVIDGSYKNLVSAIEKPRNSAPSAFKQAQIESTMEKKAQNIEKAQNNKEWGMKVSATWRDAVILATTEYKDKTVLDGLDQAVLKWRRFCWDNFDVEIEDTDALIGKLNK